MVTRVPVPQGYDLTEYKNGQEEVNCKENALVWYAYRGAYKMIPAGLTWILPLEEFPFKFSFEEWLYFVRRCAPYKTKKSKGIDGRNPETHLE